MNDFPEFSTDELVCWLQAKYRRHSEIEDGVAAERLKSLSTENECLQNARDAMKWIRTDTAHKAPEQITVELLAAYISKLEGALTTTTEQDQCNNT